MLRESDVFRDNRTTFRIMEPLVSFYHAIMRPLWADLEHARDGTRLWQRSRRRFVGHILGPHYEQLCRQWTRHMAGADLLGDYAYRVGAGTVNDPVAKTSYQLDVVVFGRTDDNRPTILAIGEAKWGETIGVGHLERLRHIRGLLSAQGRLGAATARLLCYSGAGFSDKLWKEAEVANDVRLVGLSQLY